MRIDEFPRFFLFPGALVVIGPEVLRYTPVDNRGIVRKKHSFEGQGVKGVEGFFFVGFREIRLPVGVCQGSIHVGAERLPLFGYCLFFFFMFTWSCCQLARKKMGKERGGGATPRGLARDTVWPPDGPLGLWNLLFFICFGPISLKKPHPWP